MSLLSVRDLSLRLRSDAGDPVQLLYDINLDLEPGEVVGLVGESGSGKTLTGLSILGLLPPSARVSGQILFDGRDLLRTPAAELRALRGRELSMIFQEPRASLNPVLTVGRQVVDVLRAHLDITRAAAGTTAADLFGQVGLPEPKRMLEAYVHELSGGMCQRVVIAMALACGPRLLVADEPTTALDVTIQAQIVDLLRQLADDRGLTVLLISHNLGVITEICDRVITLYAGEVVHLTSRDELLRHPTHPYTGRLLDAARLAAGRQMLTAAAGQPANAARPPAGCRYHPRCPYAEDRCRVVHPDLLSDGVSATRCLRSGELDLVGLTA